MVWGEVYGHRGQGRRYCSRSCATAARSSGAGKQGKWVRLVYGMTSMYTGLDGLLAIIRYHLKFDP